MKKARTRFFLRASVKGRVKSLLHQKDSLNGRKSISWVQADGFC
jgi:hypothetical protein